MGKALEIVIGRVTNPGAGPVALTPGSGDSFVVRNFPSPSSAYLENVWAQNATAGLVRIRSPRLHDNVQGIRLRSIAASVRGLLADQLRQPLYAQDNLTLEMGGGAAEVDAAAFMFHYDDVPGLDARLATWAQIQPRIVNILTQEVALTTSATAGDWPAGSALNASFDLLQANTDYAVLGYITDATCLALTVRGPDTGNVRIGGPGTSEVIETRDWFVSLADAINGPAIPVINAANKAATVVSAASTAIGATVNCDLVLAELSPGTI